MSDNPYTAVVYFGPRGPEGPRGEDSTTPGLSNVLAIGTVTTLAPGEVATAELVGTSPHQVLNLGIPQGAKGDVGLWVFRGPFATVAEAAAAGLVYGDPFLRSDGLLAWVTVGEQPDPGFVFVRWGDGTVMRFEDGKPIQDLA